LLWLVPWVFLKVARDSLETKARGWGAEIHIGRASLGWGGIRFKEVRLHLRDAPAVEASLEKLWVGISLTGSVRSVVVGPGTITLSAPFAELQRQLEQVQQRRPHANSGRSFAFATQDLQLLWHAALEPQAADLAVTGVTAVREPTGWRVAAETLTADQGSRHLRIEHPRLQLQKEDDQQRLDAFSAQRLVLSFEKTPEPRELPPAAEPPAHRTSTLMLHAVGLLRSMLLDPLSPLRQRISPQVHATIEQTGVTYDDHESTPLALAFGRTQLSADDDGFHLTVASSTTAGATPLRLLGHLPWSAQKPLHLHLAGGPLPLHALGFRDGNLGLTDGAQARFEGQGDVDLSADGAWVTYEASGQVHNLALRHPALAPEALEGLRLGLRLRGEARLDGSWLALRNATFDLAGVAVSLTGEITRAEANLLRIDGTLEVPSSPCQGVMDALPKGFAPSLEGLRMDGLFSLRTTVHFDSQHPADAQVALDFQNACRITHVPPLLQVNRFRSQFHRSVYDPQGNRIDMVSGPGTPSWVPYTNMSPFLTTALMVTEDGGFFYHHGFDREAIRNSLRENLRAQKFVRGASTLSMQTAKNLYLERRKDISRKVQEAILTTYLEQSLSKYEILELYLNSVEFGPMVYGIEAAADHYFHTSPLDLSLAQSLFLCSLLPSPKTNHFDASGHLQVGWAGYMRKLLGILLKRHLIDENEYRLAMGEEIRLGLPSSLRVQVHGEELLFAQRHQLAFSPDSFKGKLL